MDIEKLKKELLLMLENNDIDFYLVELAEYDKDTDEIDKCTICLNDIDSSIASEDRSLYQVKNILEAKDILHKFENKFNVQVINLYMKI